MSEARELLDKVRGRLFEHVTDAYGKGFKSEAATLAVVGSAIAEALATQPEPRSVPELPEWSWQDDEGDLRIRLASKHMVQILDAELSPDDLDRIAEACTKLAARERARRAGS